MEKDYTTRTTSIYIFLMITFQCVVVFVLQAFDPGKSFLYVTTHEIGHTLGLAHSVNWRAMMSSKYPIDVQIKLTEDDIKAIRTIYGNCRFHLSYQSPGI